MKQKILFVFALLCVPLTSEAQLYNDPILGIDLHQSNNQGSMLQLSSAYSLGSNALTNQFYNNLFGPSLISDDAKNSVLPYLKTNNGFGAYLHNSVFFSWKPKEDNLRFYVSISSRQQFAGAFSADAYKLLLYGNSQFAGQTANFGGFSISGFAYQSFQFGVYRYAIHNSLPVLYGGGIAVVGGSAYQNLYIPQGTLFTSASGDSMLLDAQLVSRQVPALNPYTEVNGLGASLNAFVGVALSKTSSVRVQVEDLGLIDWTHNVQALDAGAHVPYTGERVSVLDGNISVTHYYQALDTLANQIGTPVSGKSFATMLPFQVRVLYSKEFGQNLSLTAGGEYIHDEMKVPEIDFAARRSFWRERLGVRIGFSLFGYSDYGLDLGVDFNIGKRLRMVLGSQHFEGLFSPSATHGQGYFASLNWLI